MRATPEPPHGHIRPAEERELPLLQDIERAAGRWFSDAGMASVALDDPPGLAVLASLQREGRARVWADAADRPVAYLIGGVVDGSAHLHQVSVQPDSGLDRRPQACMRCDL